MTDPGTGGRHCIIGKCEQTFCENPGTVVQTKPFKAVVCKKHFPLTRNYPRRVGDANE